MCAPYLKCRERKKDLPANSECIFADWQFFLELIWEPVTFPVVCVSDSDCNIAVLAKHVTSPFSSVSWGEVVFWKLETAI